MPNLNRSKSSRAGGDGGGDARPPWMRGRLALRGLSWWGSRLTTTITATADSTAAFMAAVAMRAAGFSGDTKGASQEGRPDAFCLAALMPTG